MKLVSARLHTISLHRYGSHPGAVVCRGIRAGPSPQSQDVHAAWCTCSAALIPAEGTSTLPAYGFRIRGLGMLTDFKIGIKRSTTAGAGLAAVTSYTEGRSSLPMVPAAAQDGGSSLPVQLVPHDSLRQGLPALKEKAEASHPVEGIQANVSHSARTPSLHQSPTCVTLQQAGCGCAVAPLHQSSYLWSHSLLSWR